MIQKNNFPSIIFNNNQFICVFLLFILILISGCEKDKKCEEILVYQNKISITESNLIPYIGTESLIFINTKTKDTIVFVCTSKFKDFGKQIDYQDVECPITYVIERERAVFQSQKPPYKLTVSLIYHDYRDILYLEIQFGDRVFNNASINFGRKYDKDSLKINNETYYDLYYFKNDFEPELNTPYGCFYTLNNINPYKGLVRIEGEEGSLDLVKITQ